MRYAFLIPAVNSARQLKKLVDRLDHGQFDIYIHVSKKTNLSAYDDVMAKKNVFLVDQRIATNTGGYSKIEAILTGLHQILTSEIVYQNITLLSSRDYPIKTAKDIIAFYRANEGRQLISYTDDWYKAHKSNFEKHTLIDLNIPGRAIAERLFNFFKGKPRLPKNLKIRGGSSHWAITPDCAKYVVDYIERFGFKRSLKYVLNTEKFLFQSIIMRSSFKNAVINNNYRYTDRSANSQRSRVLKTNDLGKLLISEHLFAGRFDIRDDEKIFDLINEAVDQKAALQQ